MNVVQPIRDPLKVQAIEEYLLSRGKRDWLLFVAGCNSGLRISDLLKLRAGDVRGVHLVLVETKTKKRKFIRINPKLGRAFKEYAGDLDDRVFLFQSREGVNKPMTRVRAYQVLREAAERHGLPHIGTHTLRKTFGYHFYKATKNVALLQEIFSHSSPQITLRYIGINQDEMDKAIAAFSI